MKSLRTAYNYQKGRAKHRNIEWFFTFETWLKWWEETGKLHLRGNTKEKPYKMCRYGDTGAYSPQNVYCGDNHDSVSDLINNGTHFGGKKYKPTKLACSMGGKSGGGSNRLSEEEVKERLDKISHIDLSRFGWVALVSGALGVSHTQARRFIDKYYNGDVYKRS